MRLIDEDTIIQNITQDWFLDILAVEDKKSNLKKMLTAMIKNQPAAYDVGEVLKQIHDELYCYDIPNSLLDDIVKRGGRE